MPRSDTGFAVGQEMSGMGGFVVSGAYGPDLILYVDGVGREDVVCGHSPPWAVSARVAAQ
jgi:hypothetical protein